jgi:beta-lactamase class A
MIRFLKTNCKGVTIGVLLVACVSLCALYITERRSNPVHALDRFSYINPSRNLTEQRHFFSTINPLRVDMRETVAAYEAEGYRIGLYFEYLNTGANISINPDMRFWPASLSKMPTAFVVMKKVQDGEWKLSNELVLFDEDKDDRFGTLYKEPVGTRITVDDLLQRLLIDSDNTAHKIFIRNMSSNEYDVLIEALGMEDLFDKEYDITAKEYSRIFSALFNASYLNREHSQLLLQYLAETPFTEFIDAGVPEDVTFSHKIGEEFEKSVFLDSGIVYVPDRPYLITIMVDTSANNGGVDKAKEIMKTLSQKAYTYVATY